MRLVFAFAIVVALLATAVLWPDEPRVLRVYCIPNCPPCQRFAADETREPLKTALAPFRVEHVQGGAARFPTFRIEGNPAHEKEGYLGPDDLIRWIRGAR